MLLNIWEYGEHPIISVAHSFVYVRRSSVVFSKHSVCAIFFLLLFEKTAQLCTSCFLHSTKTFEKSLGTFNFGGFITIFVAESLFAFSAALIKFAKQPAHTQLKCKSSKVSRITITTRISAIRSTTYVVFSFKVSVFSSFDLEINIRASLFLFLISIEQI